MIEASIWLREFSNSLVYIFEPEAGPYAYMNALPIWALIVFLVVALITIVCVFLMEYRRKDEDD